MLSLGALGKEGKVMPPPGGWPDAVPGAAAMRSEPDCEAWRAPCDALRALLHPDPASRTLPLHMLRDAKSWFGPSAGSEDGHL